MIPLKLEIEGFLVYKEKISIDFTDIKYGVITGENGVGKSSLLDAILYALYGKARDAEKTEDLINESSSKAIVVFEFSVKEGIYKVAREKDRLGNSRLYLYKYQPDLHNFISTGHRGIKANEEIIERILGLSYEAFTSSVILVQDKSDKFLSAKPNERKNILSEILGLTIYEKIRQKASDYLKQTRIELNYVNNNLIALQDMNEDTIVKLKLDLTNLNVELEKQKQLYAHTLSNLNHLKELHKIKSEITEIFGKLESFQKIFVNKDEIVNNYELLQASQKIYFSLVNFHRLSNEINALKGKITSESEEEVNYHKNLEELHKKLETENLLFNQINLEIRDLRTKVSQNDIIFERLSKQLEKLNIRQAELKDNDICPLCGSIISEENKGHITSEIEEIKKDLEISAQKKVDLTIILSQKEKIWNNSNELIFSLNSNLNITKGTLLAITKNLTKNQVTLDKLNNESIVEEQNILRERNAGNIVYNLKLEEIETIIKNKELFESDYQKYLISVKQMEELNNQLEKLSIEENKVTEQIKSLPDSSFVQSQLSQSIKNLEKIIEELNFRKDGFLRKLGAYEEQLKNKENFVFRKQKLDNEDNVYSFFVKAFSSDNIQTMVVNKALRDIENYSTQLLKKLSNNRFSLDFIEQSSQNSLDIQVHDVVNQTNRKYNLLSGGEKFKTALSVALGIRRYVSSISHKAIECIIIDEGFAALDKMGRESLIQVIDDIQGEIKMILIITHLEDVAEVFPWQIKLSKNQSNDIKVSKKYQSAINM